MEMRGVRTERGNINRGIEARNQIYANGISKLREDVNAYTADGVPLFPYGREALSVYGIELPDVPQGPAVISYVEPKEQAPAAPQRESAGHEAMRGAGPQTVREEGGKKGSSAPERENRATEPPKV